MVLKQTTNRLFVFILGMILVSLLVITCNNPQDNTDGNNQQDEITYKRFLQDEEDIKYTFEYPETYDDCQLDDNNPPWVSCTRWENEGWLDSSIHILSWDNRTKKYGDAEEYSADELNRIEEVRKGFKIIEKNDIKIDGLQGYFFQCSQPVDVMYESDLKEPTILTIRYVFFEAHKYIWEITMTSIESVADKDELGWKHLIESFHFLD